MKSIAAWFLLLFLAIIIIIAGARGRLGSVIGALVTPSQMVNVPDS